MSIARITVVSALIALMLFPAPVSAQSRHRAGVMQRIGGFVKKHRKVLAVPVLGLAAASCGWRGEAPKPPPKPPKPAAQEVYTVRNEVVYPAGTQASKPIIQRKAPASHADKWWVEYPASEGWHHGAYKNGPSIAFRYKQDGQLETVVISEQAIPALRGKQFNYSSTTPGAGHVSSGSGSYQPSGGSGRAWGPHTTGNPDRPVEYRFGNVNDQPFRPYAYSTIHGYNQQIWASQSGGSY
jgi:hypothetical protein